MEQLSENEVGLYEKAKEAHDLIDEIFEAFKEKGIEIPFPQRDIHVHHHGNLDPLVKTAD